MPQNILRQQFSTAFDSYAQEGIALFRAQSPDSTPVFLSHICFKFSDLATYTQFVSEAREEGVVTRAEFKGSEITWCHLAEPLEKGGLRLEWLELVEPRREAHPFSGAASIGYSVPGLPGVVKLQSGKGSMVFRYQARHAAAMAASQG